MKNREAKSVVVIGAGMGGLSAAIRLAAAGLDVTLIEQGSGPGGKMRTVPSVAGPVDAGPTVLTMREVFDDLFVAAGTRLEDHLTLIPQPLLARHWWTDGSTLDLFTDPEQSTAAIADLAGPREADAFRRFNRLSTQLYSAFDAPMMWAARPRLASIALNALANPQLWPALNPGRSLARQIAADFKDPRMRQLFGRYATYVGGAPDLSPAVLAVIWASEARGVWAVHGGMHELAKAMAGLAESLGAVLNYGVSARRIERQGGRVVAVELSDGRLLRCDQVVFNGDPAALLAGLLGNGPQGALRPSAAHPRSHSAWVWAFAATPQGADLVHHNVFFCDDPEAEFGPVHKGQMPEEATLYICAQDRAAGPPQGPERFEII
ncbi:MAG: phytoene desaturase family protein, partial [Paracoccaceae bacterium]